MKTVIFLVVAMIATNAVMTARADDFMDADTERARLTEANGECRIAGALGADVNSCVSAYLCSNYGDCDGEGVQPIAPTPWGVYRDTSGVSNG